MPTVRRDLEVPIAAQIEAHFAAAIDGGRVPPGGRLPTIRAVAAASGVTRATVQEAYRRLAQRGLVQSTVGRGTVAAPHGARAAGPVSAGGAAAMAQLRRILAVPSVPAGRAVTADFSRLEPDPDRLPVDAFRRSLDRVLERDGGRLLGYGWPAGSEELRRVLARRHGHGEAEHVLITSGAQQGIDLVLRAVTSPGDAVAVATPTYHQLFGVLAACGVQVVPLPSERGAPADLGAVRRVLDRPDVRLLYVMPSFHNPTGTSLDPAQRRELMDVVAETDVPVLEDEFECELRFEGEPPPTLHSLDPRGLTATVRTFSKALFPGVRIGWVCAGRRLLGPMTALKRFTDLESSPFVQAALLDMIETGAMAEHLERFRGELAERHAAAQVALREWMPQGTNWTRPSGGLAVWVELPDGIDAERVADRAANDGVLVTPGRVFDPFDRPSRGMRLTLARVDVDQVRSGIAIIARAAAAERAAVDAPTTSQPPLIL